MLLEVPAKAFGVHFGGSWEPFCGLRRRLYAASEKVLRRTVLRCKSQTLPMAKTSKPYSTSIENRR